MTPRTRAPEPRRAAGTTQGGRRAAAGGRRSRQTGGHATATWLAADERQWLESELGAEQQAIERTGHLTLWKGLTDRRVLGLSFVYLTIVTATYGVTFFLPLIVKTHGLSNVATGLVTAVPYTVGAIGMLFWAHSSDRRHERRWHFIVAALLRQGAWSCPARPVTSLVALAAMSVATIGLYGSKPAFWPLPSAFLGGTAAAGGIALVNSIGNLGGFAGPMSSAGSGMRPIATPPG